MSETDNDIVTVFGVFKKSDFNGQISQKDARIKELEVENEELKKRLSNSKEYDCDCLDRVYENHSCQKELGINNE